MKYKISIIFGANYKTTNVGIHDPRKFTSTMGIGIHEEKYFHSICHFTRVP